MKDAIHPTAVIEDGARLGAGVEIGPFCHVGPQTTLGDGVRLASPVSLSGETKVGRPPALLALRSEGPPVSPVSKSSASSAGAFLMRRSTSSGVPTRCCSMAAARQAP